MMKKSSENSPKWSFGNFFRRKARDHKSDSSSEEDGGGTHARRHRSKNSKQNRASKLNAFDHIVVAPNAQSHINYINSADPFMLPGQNTRSLDHQFRSNHAPKKEPASSSSSEGDPGMKYSCSVENVNSLNRKSRAARTERYLRRMTRDRSSDGSCNKSTNFDQIGIPRSPNLRSAQSLCQMNSIHVESSPPVPPRKYQRSLTIAHNRPVSCVFDENQYAGPNYWLGSQERLPRANSVQSEQPKRFIRRHESAEQYIADINPRSRKPIRVSIAPQTPSYSQMPKQNLIRSKSVLHDYPREVPAPPEPSIFSKMNYPNFSSTFPSSSERVSVPKRGVPESPADNVVNGRLCLKKSENPKHHNYQLQVDTLPAKKPVIQSPTYKRKSWQEVAFHKNSKNLEEAIVELENIYKSLQISDSYGSDGLFYQQKAVFPNFYETNGTDDCPDIVRDDLLNRSMRDANLSGKVLSKQPPFGIPVRPIDSMNSHNYLDITPKVEEKACRIVPDIANDDLAFRNLRKDLDVPKKDRKDFPIIRIAKDPSSPTGMIQRAACFPSGALKSLVGDENSNVLPNPEAKKAISGKIYAHGAIFNLPSNLKTSSAPKTSDDEEINLLSQIANEAKITSETLGRELVQLRLSKSVSPYKKKEPEKPSLQSEVSEATKAVKICEETMKSVAKENGKIKCSKAEKLKMVQDIKEAADAAKICEKILCDIISEGSSSPELIKARLEIDPTNESVHVQTRTEKTSENGKAGKSMSFEKALDKVKSPPRIFESIAEHRRLTRVSEDSPENEKISRAFESLYQNGKNSSHSENKKAVKVISAPTENGMFARISEDVTENGRILENHLEVGKIGKVPESGSEEDAGKAKVLDTVALKVPVKSIAANFEKELLKTSHKSAFVPIKDAVPKKTSEIKIVLSTVVPNGSKSPQYENLRKTPEKVVKPREVSMEDSGSLLRHQHSREDEINDMIKECEEYSLQQTREESSKKSPVREGSQESSLYNSTEELAAIFGISANPPGKNVCLKNPNDNPSKHDVKLVLKLTDCESVVASSWHPESECDPGVDNKSITEADGCIRRKETNKTKVEQTPNPSESEKAAKTCDRVVTERRPDFISQTKTLLSTEYLLLTYPLTHCENSDLVTLLAIVIAFLTLFAILSL